MQNFVEIGRTIAEIWQFMFFSRWRPSTILDLWGKFWDEPHREFDGLYTVQNLVAIGLVVLIIQKFEYFARFFPENAYSCPILTVLGVKIGEMDSF